MGSKWLIVQSVLFELGGIAGLLHGTSVPQQLLIFVSCHSMVCGLSSLVLWRLMPRPYRTPVGWSYAFLFVVQWAIPFVGGIGLAAGMLLALYLPRKQRRLPWEEIEIPDLPHKPIEVSAQPLYSQGGLMQVLRDAADTNKRLLAVMATKQMRERDSVAILQEALKDQADDVRLLAYSMLDAKEKVLSDQIKQALDELPGATAQQTYNLHRLLAFNYWEVAYLGLAQGGVRRHYLDCALRNIEQALQSDERDAGMYRLLGRIQLERGDLENAERTFLRALGFGISRQQVMLFLVEIAYLRRDFRYVRRLLQTYRPILGMQGPLADLYHFWNVHDTYR